MMHSLGKSLEGWCEEAVLSLSLPPSLTVLYQYIDRLPLIAMLLTEIIPLHFQITFFLDLFTYPAMSDNSYSISRPPYAQVHLNSAGDLEIPTSFLYCPKSLKDHHIYGTSHALPNPLAKSLVSHVVKTLSEIPAETLGTGDEIKGTGLYFSKQANELLTDAATTWFNALFFNEDKVLSIPETYLPKDSDEQTFSFPGPLKKRIIDISTTGGHFFNPLVSQDYTGESKRQFIYTVSMVHPENLRMRGEINIIPDLDTGRTSLYFRGGVILCSGKEKGISRSDLRAMRTICQQVLQEANEKDKEEIKYGLNIPTGLSARIEKLGTEYLKREHKCWELYDNEHDSSTMCTHLDDLNEIDESSVNDHALYLLREEIKSLNLEGDMEGDMEGDKLLTLGQSLLDQMPPKPESTKWAVWSRVKAATTRRILAFWEDEHKEIPSVKLSLVYREATGPTTHRFDGRAQFSGDNSIDDVKPEEATHIKVVYGSMVPRFVDISRSAYQPKQRESLEEVVTTDMDEEELLAYILSGSSSDEPDTSEEPDNRERWSEEPDTIVLVFTWHSDAPPTRTTIQL